MVVVLNTHESVNENSTFRKMEFVLVKIVKNTSEIFISWNHRINHKQKFLKKKDYFILKVCYYSLRTLFQVLREFIYVVGKL